MNKLTLDQAYHLLRKFSRVELEGDVWRMQVAINGDGLVITLKNNRETNVMLMTRKHNEVIFYTENYISLYDGSNWQYDFIPLAPADLHVVVL